MPGGDIYPTEFQKVSQKVEKFRKLKADIKNQTKAKIKQTRKEKRVELLEQGRKEGKEEFLRKIAKNSRPTVPVPFKIRIFSTLRHVIL